MIPNNNEIDTKLAANALSSSAKDAKMSVLYPTGAPQKSTINVRMMPSMLNRFTAIKPNIIPSPIRNENTVSILLRFVTLGLK